MTIIELDNVNVMHIEHQVNLIENITFQVKAGECLGIVGESGSGKSLTCRSVLQLQEENLLLSGNIYFKKECLNRLSPKKWQHVRGKHIFMIMQNGITAFDPSQKVISFLQHTISLHTMWKSSKINEKLDAAFHKVDLPPLDELKGKYPHQLSGGMLQRLMIVLAVVLKPELIIADEPTTALDSISQFQVMEQFQLLRREMNSAMIFVSHDLGLVNALADQLIVMKDGMIVEQGNCQRIMRHPEHSYTQYLVETKRKLSAHFHQMIGESNADY